MFGLTILGNNSAIPAFDRHPTSQALTFDDQVFLIDCGEGTQMQIVKYKIRGSRINHIFISHLHGDHYFGLIGLITSMGLSGRSVPLHIYAPAILEKVIGIHLVAASTNLPFHIHFHPHPNTYTKILDSEKMEVWSFPVQHRIPCFGFVFREKKAPRKINGMAARFYQVPYSFFASLQKGEDYISSDGDILKNELLTLKNPDGLSYAFSADTIYDESICQYFAEVHLLYHESTYMTLDQDKAAERFHSTSEQAARIALRAGVKRLLIGHFSSRYEDLTDMLAEATDVFENTELALEGVTYLV
ncbi:MAG: ribonuclease Z [Chitinophagaceae bacterium]